MYNDCTFSHNVLLQKSGKDLRSVSVLKMNATFVFRTVEASSQISLATCSIKHFLIHYVKVDSSNVIQVKSTSKKNGINDIAYQCDALWNKLSRDFEVYTNVAAFYSTLVTWKGLFCSNGYLSVILDLKSNKSKIAKTHRSTTSI